MFLRCCTLTVVLMVALLTGCTQSIGGTGQGASLSAPPPPPVAVSDLLIEPERFPAQYPAAKLSPQEVDPVLRDVDGVVGGSDVTPTECTPPAPGPAPRDTAAVQGTDSAKASSLIVSVTRTPFPLSARGEQLAGCPSFTAMVGEASSMVTVTMLAPPPVDAEDSYAVDQTVTTEPSGSVTRSVSLVAQIADIRVSATWLRDGAPPEAEGEFYGTPDSDALDILFTDAVLKIRRSGG